MFSVLGFDPVYVLPNEGGEVANDGGWPFLRTTAQTRGNPRLLQSRNENLKYQYTRIPEMGSEFGVGGSWILKNGSVHLPRCTVLSSSE